MLPPSLCWYSHASSVHCSSSPQHPHVPLTVPSHCTISAPDQSWQSWEKHDEIIGHQSRNSGSGSHCETKIQQKPIWNLCNQGRKVASKFWLTATAFVYKPRKSKCKKTVLWSNTFYYVATFFKHESRGDWLQSGYMLCNAKIHCRLTYLKKPNTSNKVRKV